MPPRNVAGCPEGPNMATRHSAPSTSPFALSRPLLPPRPSPPSAAIGCDAAERSRSAGRNRHEWAFGPGCRAALRLPGAGEVLLGAEDKRFQAVIVVSLARWFADAEIKLGMHGTDLQPQHAAVNRGAECRVFGLQDVVDVVVLVGGHVEVDGAGRRELQPVSGAVWDAGAAAGHFDSPGPPG